MFFMQVAYLIVDEMHAEHPELVKDQFWDEGVPDELPYTLAAEEFRQAEPWQGSTAEVEVPEEQSEFVYLDKIEEEEDGDNKHPDTDTEAETGQLKEIKIDGLLPSQLLTKPVTISNGNNGKLKSVRESVASNLTQLGVRRNESAASVMGLIRRALGGGGGAESSSRLNLAGAGAGSALSIGGGATGTVTRTASRVRGKRRRHGFQRSVSNASPMSHENVSQGLSRVNTHEHAIFKMSDTSSVNSLNSADSNFPSRSNSEATALFEVREILKKDLALPQSPHEAEDEKDAKYGRARGGGRRREELKKSDSHVSMLRRKLEQVQALQAEIMKSLDAETKLTDSHDLELDAEDVIRLLEQKAAELKRSYRGRGVAAARVRGSSSGVDLAEAAAEAGSPLHEHETRGQLWRSRHPSIGLEPGHGGQERIVRGSVTSPGPASPVPRPDLHEIGELIKIKTFPPVSSNLGSETSFAPDSVFDMDSVREADDEGGEDDPDDQDEEEDCSDPQSVVEAAAAAAGGEDAAPHYEDTSWDNLGTIEEQPELGYQSDSNDTTELLARGRQGDTRVKLAAKTDSDPLLPTVLEER